MPQQLLFGPDGDQQFAARLRQLLGLLFQLFAQPVLAVDVGCQLLFALFQSFQPQQLLPQFAQLALQGRPRLAQPV